MLHRIVLATRNLPGISMVYRGIYRRSAEFAARSLASIPGVEGVSLHRGMTRPGWEPGVSDIDLVIRGNASAYGAVLSRAQSLRAFIPMLGDLWIGEDSEYRNYARWGGNRVAEDLALWKPLAGSGPVSTDLPGSSENKVKRAALDPWVWSFTAYVEASRRVLCGGGVVGEKDLADLRKASADTVRLAHGSKLREIDRTASVDQLWLSAALSLSEFSRSVLNRTADGTSPLTLPEPRDVEERSRLNVLLDGPVRGVVFDPPYHTYLILEEDASEADFKEAARIAVERSPGGVPLILTPSSWELCLQGSYLGAPLGAFGKYGKPGGLFGDGGPRVVGSVNGAVRRLPLKLRWEIAAEAASWMLLWRRPLWGDANSGNQFVLFHLFTRAAGLRLALEGEEVPFWDWDALMKRSAEIFPEEADLYESLERYSAEEPEEAVNGLPRERLDPSLERGLDILFDRISKRLELCQSESP